MSKVKKQEEQKQSPVNAKPSKKTYIATVGRRKEAIARVRLWEGKGAVWLGAVVEKGAIVVNGKPVEVYFPQKTQKVQYLEPFKLTKTEGKFAVTVKVEGGGLSGQLDAMIHGISRALDAYNKEGFHAILRNRGFLTRDARVRQRRKVGMGGKSRRKRQSPKR